MPGSVQPPELIANRLLAALTPQEYNRLRPHLEVFTLTLGEVVYEPGQTIRHVYFPNSGIVSLLSLAEPRSTLEVGVVGREGMVGISIFLGSPDSLNRALVQGAGSAMRMTAQAFRRRVGTEGPLPDMLRHYTHTLLTQISQTAVCNRFHNVEERLARWLLLTHDRLGTDDFSMTQKFLSDMLGVRREGVTIAASALQDAKVIRYVRGHITVLDRAGLEAASCQCYSIVGQHSRPRRRREK